MTHSENNDPLGYIDDLRDVLGSPALQFLGRVQYLSFYTDIVDWVNIAHGMTAAAFLDKYGPNLDPSDVLIRVNRKSVPLDYELQSGDRVTVTPTRIVGAYSATEDPIDAPRVPAIRSRGDLSGRFAAPQQGQPLPPGEQTADRWEIAENDLAGNEELSSYALEIISALGFCRLYGIKLPPELSVQLSSPLPPKLLVPAINAAIQMLDAATDDARTLPERFDDAEPLEDRLYCTDMLHLLMESWAFFIVIDGEYERHLCSGESIESRFSQLMRRLLDAFTALDNEIQQEGQIRLLSVATELPLLDNWRKMLAEPYRAPLPWWLDGTLEAAAEQTRQEIASYSMVSSLPQKGDARRPPTVPPSHDLRIASDKSGQQLYAPDLEFAMAASDSSGTSLHPTPAECRTIQYLSTHLLEMLECHSNSKVWFKIDSSGAIVDRTYDKAIADRYSVGLGPSKVPAFIELSKRNEPEVQALLVQTLLRWLQEELGLSKPVVEQVCINLGRSL